MWIKQPEKQLNELFLAPKKAYICQPWKWA